MMIRGWLSFSRLITGYVDKGSCAKVWVCGFWKNGT